MHADVFGKLIQAGAGLETPQKVLLFTLLFASILVAFFTVLYSRPARNLIRHFPKVSNTLDRLGDWVFNKVDRIFDLDAFFLKKDEWEITKKQRYEKDAHPDELKEKYERILKEHAGKYTPEPIGVKRELLTFTPTEVQSFFGQFDYLDFTWDEEFERHVLDIKSLRKFSIGDESYIEIGRDEVGEEDETIFAVRETTAPAEHGGVFWFSVEEADNEESPEFDSSDTKLDVPDICSEEGLHGNADMMRTLVNFVCYMQRDFEYIQKSLEKNKSV